MSIACRLPMCRSRAPIRSSAIAPMARSRTRSPPSPARIAAGLLEGGVLPVLKHLPGHGRATADSHAKLPVVDTDRATLEATDFAAFRPLGGPAARHDRTCCVYRHRPGRAGHHFGHYSAGSDSRFDRVLGAVDERRRLDGRVVGLARRAHARPRSQPVATWCFTATARWRKCAQSPPQRRSSQARPRAAPRPRWRSASRPAPIDIAARRAEFFKLMAGAWQPAPGSA